MLFSPLMGVLSHFVACALLCALLGRAGNPLVVGVGMADPHVHVWGSKTDAAQQTVFMYATHDWSPSGGTNLGFRMDNWWVWSSADLVTWKMVDVLQPTDTYIKKNFSQCWATDAAYRNGSYFFYLSIGDSDIGVVRSSSPVGPWTDPLGKALIAHDMPDLPGNAGSRDPGILQDADGTSYIIFGTFQYYMARLNPDMITLAEKPRQVNVTDAFGPFGFGTLDDKAFLHAFNGTYYLSWGCFYGTSNSVYGPFKFQGSVIYDEFLAPSFQGRYSQIDRHGSFFELHGQWYFASNDRSHGGNVSWRSTSIGYVHYADDGHINPVVIDESGVGQYNVSSGAPVGGGGGGVLQAANYFGIENAQKKQRRVGRDGQQQQQQQQGGAGAGLLHGRAQLWTCTTAEAGGWVLILNSSANASTIHPAGNRSLCLTSDWTEWVELSTELCNGTPDQLWRVTVSGGIDDGSDLVNVGTNSSIQVVSTAGQTAADNKDDPASVQHHGSDGAPVQAYGNTAANHNQKWTVAAAAGSTAVTQIRSWSGYAAGYCLAVRRPPPAPAALEFEVVGLKQGSVLSFPNVHGVSAQPKIALRVSNGGSVAGEVLLYAATPAAPGPGAPLPFGKCNVGHTGSWDTYASVSCELSRDLELPSPLDLTLVFSGNTGGEFGHLASIAIE
jgi:hypothetical protein